MKRVWFLLFFFLLALPFAFAANGCCGETVTGETCRYAAEEDCATPDYFETNVCEGVSWCGTGCCVMGDGACAEGAGEYSCAVEGVIFYDGETCSLQSSCEEVCCQLGDDYDFVTQAQCDTLAEETGVETIVHAVDESGCYDLEHSADLGCCVTEGGCISSSQGDCGTGDFDSGTGYGFYSSEACADIASDLEEDGLEAAEYCQCEKGEEYYTCDADSISVLATDSCENIGEVVESCDYPDEVCSETNGAAQCVSSLCGDTFSFPEKSGFENFNVYPVYYEISADEWAPELLYLGEPRDNGESWCIYESPVGSFRDRVGSQHYRAGCSGGEEFIENCASDRSEVCITTYDPVRDMFSAGCYSNNYDSFYSLQESEDYYGSIYPSEDPEESGDDISEGFGASTVTRARVMEESTDGTIDYCDLADFDCELSYGDTVGDDQEGWELYVNSYCLRQDFTFIAADYCASRGVCGLQENILGVDGGKEGFSIDFPEDFNDVDIGCGEDCFDQQEESGDNDFADAAQCSDASAGSGCVKHSVALDGEAYYDLIDFSAEDPVIQYSFLTASVAPALVNDREELLEKTGAEYSDCLSGEQILARLLYALGTDVHSSSWYSIVDNPSGRSGSDFILQKPFCGDVYGGAYCLDDCEADCFNSCSDVTGDCTNGCIDCVDACDAKCASVCDECIEPCSEYCEKAGLEGDDCSVLCDDAIVDQPFVEHGLFNAFRSLKPWYLSFDSLYPDTKTSLTSVYERSLLVYDGDFGRCNIEGEGNEWEDVWGEKEWALNTEKISYDCEPWAAPEDGDCSLCDISFSNGGTLFTDSEGNALEASYCNPFRCESLGNNCLFVGDNYGSGHPSCVDAPCTSGSLSYVGPYMDALIDSGISSTYDGGASDGASGYSITDIPVGETFSFGLETSTYSHCLFVQDNSFEALSSAYVVDNIALIVGSPSYDKESFYDTLSQYALVETPVWDERACESSADCGEGYLCDDEVCVCSGEDPYCSESLDVYHNFTFSLQESEEETQFAVWCKDSCGNLREDFYYITLEAGFDPPSTEPEIGSVSPQSGSQVAYDHTSEDVTAYVTRESQCRYSSSESDSYEMMLNSGLCVSSDDETHYGYYPCDFTIPLQDGATTLYFLCQDVYGNTMTIPEQWYVSKTEALAITQTAPSGILYVNDLFLQVDTAGGASAGDAVCSYRDSSDSRYQEMSITGDSYHEQSQTNLEKGDYSYDILCTDALGNSAETQIVFTLDKDISASEVESVYYLGSTLYVITNEASTCQWDDEEFVYGGGTELAGIASTDHSLSIADLSQDYYIICIDAYENEMEPVVVDFEYLLS